MQLVCFLVKLNLESNFAILSRVRTNLQNFVCLSIHVARRVFYVGRQEKINFRIIQFIYTVIILAEI